MYYVYSINFEQSLKLLIDTKCCILLISAVYLFQCCRTLTLFVRIHIWLLFQRVTRMLLVHSDVNPIILMVYLLDILSSLLDCSTVTPSLMEVNRNRRVVLHISGHQEEVKWASAHTLKGYIL